MTSSTTRCGPFALSELIAPLTSTTVLSSFRSGLLGDDLLEALAVFSVVLDDVLDDALRTLRLERADRAAHVDDGVVVLQIWIARRRPSRSACGIFGSAR